MLDIMSTVETVARTDAGLASELRLSVMRLRRRLAVERHPDNQLSLSQMTVLGTLHRHGEMTVGDLAAHERVQPPSMTRTVDCLETDGYVRRRASESDGRQVRGLPDRGRPRHPPGRPRRRDAWLAQRLTDLDPRGAGRAPRGRAAARPPCLARLTAPD